MPGEDIEAALHAAAELQRRSIGCVLTRLGEHVKSPAEAQSTVEHYLEAMRRMKAADVSGEVSVKLTQLGLDLDAATAAANLRRIVEEAGSGSMVWIDMESSPHVDATLEVYRGTRVSFPNVGVCLQAYLRRTAADVASLLSIQPAIRLVKGAYAESPAIAFQQKKKVDENYFALAQTLLRARSKSPSMRAAIATHDGRLIEKIVNYAQSEGIDRALLEFQMLYGIKRAEQVRLAGAGYKIMVLISYGDYWFPWYMRRLAERPANVLFVIRNLI